MDADRGHGTVNTVFRDARLRLQLSQDELAQALRQAGWLGCDRRAVQRYESGLVTRPQFAARRALTAVFGVPPARLGLELATASKQEGPGQTNRRQFLVAASLAPALPSSDENLFGISEPASWASSIHQAVINPAQGARRAGQRLMTLSPDHVPEARELTRPMFAASLASDHAALTRHLPVFIGQAEWGALHSNDEPQRVWLRAASDLFGVAAWTLIKADDCAGAGVAARRSLEAAKQAEDELRVAAATRCLAEVYMRAGDLNTAGRLALVAALEVDAPPELTSDPMLCLRGAALLTAAAAAARRDDAREARVALKSAVRCSEGLRQERADLATVFGPVNVAIHQVVIALELGDARAAVAHAEEVDLRALSEALKERRSRFLIDVARAYVQLYDGSAALDALLMAERESPSETRTHRHTRAVINQLLVRPRVSPETRALADRCAMAI